MKNDSRSLSARRLGKCVMLGLCLTGSVLLAQENDRTDLGRLPTGATVSFVRATAGEWGLEVAGASAPSIRQSQPAKLEVFRSEEDIRQLAAGYKTVRKSASEIEAFAEIAFSNVRSLQDLIRQAGGNAGEPSEMTLGIVP
jgi:hypothetical protein